MLMSHMQLFFNADVTHATILYCQCHTCNSCNLV